MEIPKGNGKVRPLGIPTIMDRLVQQCVLQVLEPICEAKFHEHSYGFRPNRSTGNAIAQTYKNMQMSHLHYVVDIDIKGFFDNVNHGKLLKQLWTLGIRDKKLISIISTMLKAEVAGIGFPEKGTPQGGIISPLLSNVVLNELDWWLASQWEEFPTQYPFNDRRNPNGSPARGNKFVLGVHAYYSMATKVSADFRPIAFSVQKSLKARLRQRIKTAKEVRENKKPIHITNVIRDKYGKSDQMRYVNDLALAPIGYVRHSHPIQKAYGANSYTKNGRELVHKKLEGIDMAVLHDLMRNPIEGESIEFNDNRLSLYSAQKGKCAVTGNQMDADDVVCIRKTPKEQGGTDKYSNLLLVCRNIQKLLYIKNPDTFIAEMEKLNLDLKRTEKLLKLRSLTFVESC